MEVLATDAAFVRTSRAAVHVLVGAGATSVQWWPGLGGEMLVGANLRTGGWLRGVSIGVTHLGVRHDKGVLLECDGDLRGTLELYYLDEADGIVVTHLLRGEVTRRMIVSQLRRRVRSGLQACKDVFEARRAPGDEPDAGLQSHQRRVWSPPTAATVDDRRMRGQPRATHTGRHPRG